MAVISFTFDKYNVERKKPLEIPINVENGMNIVDVREEDIPLSNGNKEKVLRFHYEYKVDYKPNQAIIEIAGHLIYLPPKGDAKQILETWNKEKKLDKEVMQQVMNNILLRCQVKALALGQDINLPPHIRLPTVTSAPAPKEEDKKKADYTG
tara:strand:- start:56 stop:511 length:456 start_codon:yes stop_codon:yes gene_type:complete